MSIRKIQNSRREVFEERNRLWNVTLEEKVRSLSISKEVGRESREIDEVLQFDL